MPLGPVDQLLHDTLQAKTDRGPVDELLYQTLHSQAGPSPSEMGAPPAPSPSTARTMGLQGTTQNRPQLPAVDYGMGPVGNWLYRKVAPTPVGQAVGDVATQLALAPGRTVGRVASDVAGGWREVGALGKKYPAVGLAVRGLTGLEPQQIEQGAQAVQQYERPFLNTELQPTTTSGRVAQKAGEMGGMAGEAALLGPAAPIVYGVQGAGARANAALDQGVSPEKALVESGLSGLTNFALAQFMPAGKVPTPQAGALWQFAKDVALQGGKGAAAGAAMGGAENLITRIHDPNAPLTAGVGQNALEFAGFELGHTLLRLPVYQDIASQRKAVLEHPQGPLGCANDAQRMIDTVGEAQQQGLVSPEDAQSHIDTLTKMKDLATRIADTRTGKRAQARADAAVQPEPTAQPEQAPGAAPAAQQLPAPTIYSKETINGAGLHDLFGIADEWGVPIVGKAKEEIRSGLLAKREELISKNQPAQPQEVPNAAETRQVEEGHPAEYQGSGQVGEGEGIVRKPEGADEGSSAINRSGSLQEGGQVQEGAEGRAVDPEAIKEDNRETHEARLLQQIRPEFHERFLTDLDNARNTLDNRADTVLDKLQPIQDQMLKLERAYARREARGRVASAEEGLDANADYQRLRKEYESALADGHSALDSVHDATAVLADRYGIEKQDVRKAILGLGEENGAARESTSTPEERPTNGADERIQDGAAKPEVWAAETALPEHADETGVSGGEPGAEGRADVGAAGGEAYPRAEGGEGPEAEGATGGTAAEGTAGEGERRTEAAAREGGKAPDYSYPAHAPEREHIVADSLGLQQLYKKGFDLAKNQLGLPEGATEMDLVHEVGNQIGKLGASTMDTARKIMGMFKGIGQDLAKSIASLLHELNPFQGRAGEIGAVGTVKKPGLYQQEIHDRINEMYPGDENKALRHLIYSQGRILNAPTTELGVLRVQQFLKGASVDEHGNFKVLSAKEREARNAAGIPAPVFSPEPKPLAEIPKALNPYMGAIGDLLAGTPTKNGIRSIPNVPTDLNPERIKVGGDLSKLEAKASVAVPPSHVLAGGIDALGLLRKGVGSLQLRDLPQTDKLLQGAVAFHAMEEHGQAFLEKMEELGVKNNSGAIIDAMQATRDAWGKAEADYARAKLNREGNTNALKDPSFKAAERIAYIKKMEAQEACDEKMMELARDPKYGDARVAMLVDKGDNAPDELLRLCSKNEIDAARWTKSLMDVYRDGAVKAGLPVQEESYFVHQVRAGLSPDVWKAMQENGVRYGSTGLWEQKVIDPNSEEVRFAHRRPGGQMTLPDLFGGLNDYIPRAMSLITKRQVANKWTQAARLFDQAGYKNLAKYVNEDMQGYIEGYGGKHPGVDGFIDNMTRAWQAKMTAFKIGTAVKHTAKMPSAMVESGVLNNMKAVQTLFGWDSMPKEIGDPIRALAQDMVKSNRFENLEIGTGNVVSDMFRKGWSKALSATHQPVQMVEGSERAVNFIAALYDGYNRGLEPMDALREAAGRSLITNFSAVDQPGYMHSSLGRAVGVFQGTVNKIMWLNIKRTGDIIKGIEAATMKDRQFDPETRRKLTVGLKAAAMMGTITALSKHYDVPYSEWMAEAPAVYKAIAHFGEVMGANVWNVFADKNHQWNVSPMDLKREIGNGFDLAPIATQTFTNVTQHGLAAGAADTLTPQFAKDWAVKKSPQTALRYGSPGVERKVREITGAYKPSVKEAQEERRGESMAKRQATSAKKWAASWHNPLED